MIDSGEMTFDPMLVAYYLLWDVEVFADFANFIIVALMILALMLAQSTSVAYWCVPDAGFHLIL